MLVEDGTLRIKLTSEEFLSGWRKGDKLIPIITAVVYLGDFPWDGPKSLFEMLDVDTCTVRVGDEEIRLTMTKCAILKLLMQKPEQAVAKLTILERIGSELLFATGRLHKRYSFLRASMTNLYLFCNRLRIVAV